MKVYELVTMDMEGNTIDEVSFEYCGTIAKCGGNGGGSSKSTTYTTPPSWLQQYMPAVGARGWGLTQQPLKYYPSKTVAGFTPEQTQAMNLATQRATAGSPLLKTAQTEAQKTLGGEYLTPETNPFLRETYRQGASALGETFAEQTLPEIKRAAMGTGAYGGSRQGVAEGIAGRGLATAEAELANKIYGGAYGTERGIMGQTLPLAQPLAEADYGDISKLAAVGEQKQAMSQAAIDEQMARWQFGQLEPWERLGMFTNLLSGDFGGSTVSTSNTSGGGK